MGCRDYYDWQEGLEEWDILRAARMYSSSRHLQSLRGRRFALAVVVSSLPGKELLAPSSTTTPLHPALLDTPRERLAHIYGLWSNCKRVGSLSWSPNVNVQWEEWTTIRRLARSKHTNIAN